MKLYKVKNKISNIVKYYTSITKVAEFIGCSRQEIYKLKSSWKYGYVARYNDIFTLEYVDEKIQLKNIDDGSFNPVVVWLKKQDESITSYFFKSQYAAAKFFRMDKMSFLYSAKKSVKPKQTKYGLIWEVNYINKQSKLWDAITSNLIYEEESLT